MKEKYLPLVCGGFAGLLGGLILMGWQFDITALQSIIPALPKTMPLTAVLLFLCGAALALLNGQETAGPRRRRLSQLAACGATCIAVYILLEYMFARLPALEHLLLPSGVRRSGEDLPGRPSPHTILSTLFFCGALFCSSAKHSAIRRFALLPMAGTGIILWTVLFGYATAVSPFYALPSHPKIGMGILTAVGFSALCAGMFFLHAEERFPKMFVSRSSGGVVVKVLLPVALGGPLLFSWVVFSLPFSRENVFFCISAVMAITSLSLSALVLWVSYLIHRHEDERNALARQREELLAELEKTLRDLQNLKSGFLTMCAWTHKVLDQGHWVTIEEFLNRHFGLTISHGISDESLLLDDLPPTAKDGAQPPDEAEKTSVAT